MRQPLAEQPGDVGRDPPGGRSAGPAQELTERELSGAADEMGSPRGLDHPLDELRVAAVLDVAAAAGGAVALAVEGVRQPDGSGDHRSAFRPQRVLAALPARADAEAEVVAVAAEPSAQAGAEAGQVPAGGQQQLGGAQGSGGQHQPGPDDAAPAQRGRRVLGPVHHVVDPVAAAGVRADGPDLVMGPQVGAEGRGGGQVGVVEAVLGAVVAAEVAFAAQPAGAPLDAVQVAVLGLGQGHPGGRFGARLGREGDGQRR